MLKDIREINDGFVNASKEINQLILSGDPDDLARALELLHQFLPEKAQLLKLKFLDEDRKYGGDEETLAMNLRDGIRGCLKLG